VRKTLRCDNIPPPPGDAMALAMKLSTARCVHQSAKAEAITQLR